MAESEGQADQPASGPEAGSGDTEEKKREKPAPSVDERMKRMTRFGIAAAAVAILASGAALVLGIMNQGSAASDDDLDDVEQRLEEIQTVVKEATEAQLKSVNDRIGAVEQRLNSIDAQLKQNAATIAALQTQVNQLRAGAGAGTGATGTGATGAGTGAAGTGTAGGAGGAAEDTRP